MLSQNDRAEKYVDEDGKQSRTLPNPVRGLRAVAEREKQIEVKCRGVSRKIFHDGRDRHRSVGGQCFAEKRREQIEIKLLRDAYAKRKPEMPLCSRDRQKRQGRDGQRTI